MVKLLWIGAGGALGSILRYVLAGLAQRAWPGTFPVGTLAVNVLGSFALGYLAALVTGPLLVRQELRLALLVGLLGGFTTFATFAHESARLMAEGSMAAFAANVLASNILSIAAAFGGWFLGGRA